MDNKTKSINEVAAQSAMQESDNLLVANMEGMKQVPYSRFVAPKADCMTNYVYDPQGQTIGDLKQWLADWLEQTARTICSACIHVTMDELVANKSNNSYILTDGGGWSTFIKIAAGRYTDGNWTNILAIQGYGHELYLIKRGSNLSFTFYKFPALTAL